jgi:hypothetical protein
MKKVALLSFGLLFATQSYSNSNTARAKGTVKLVGSAGLGVFSLFTLKQSYATFQASRQVPAGWNMARIDYWFPQYKKEMRAAAGYQLGTTGFAALLAKQLYDSGMKDFNEDKK